jgi:hypothetical protein
LLAGVQGQIVEYLVPDSIVEIVPYGFETSHS